MKEVTSTVGVASYGWTRILWSRDFGRGVVVMGGDTDDRHLRKYFVLKVQGDRKRCGFTVDDPVKFVEALKRVEQGVTRRIVPGKERDKPREVVKLM
jgi:hypothetical protein